MAKLLQIETPALKSTFTKWIKGELRKWVKNVKAPRNLSDACEFYLYYDGDSYSFDCGMHTKYANATPSYVCGSDPFHEGGIYVDNFMYGNGFELNDESSERELTKVAHRIIDSYNWQVEMEDK